MEHTKLDAWKESVELTVDIYTLSSKFPKDELYGLTSQIRRAAVSVPSNIAEGSARKGTAETIQFLYIAVGSLAELETQIEISRRLGYISNVETITKRILLVKQLTLGLVRYLKSV
ncbi:four helix bundle protein [Williamwhitmania taraxaci]|uniref:Four helix bundle protein n=1 Tax=Williamwhitmania taraxaci TaxID=1640674 RepID=A0A1G6T213_9BACT|nr:four helix bundle protein [Williamwhitmania taraxaci]SDD22527.1 four helix bundle protein [Williamwhitmania taraxaci]